MIKFILSGFLIFPLWLPAQTRADSIMWSDKPLGWENFKGNYDTVVYNRQYGATTFWKVRYQYRPARLQNGIDFIIFAWFDANKSWVRPKNRNSKTLLLHEQGHFDLAELLARQFRQQLSRTIFSKADYTDSIRQIFSRLLTRAYATQEKYDTETSYGMDSRRQAAWQTFITSELKKLEGFQNKDLTARLIR